MENEVLQQHINRILDTIAILSKTVEGMDYSTFVKEEQVKETVYSHLQELGQAAYEIDQYQDERLDIDFDIAVLANLRQSRYNQETEMNHQGTWNIIKHELPALAEQLQESEEFVNTPE